MALFTLWRTMPPMTEIEGNSMQARAITGTWYEPRYLWQRSFGWLLDDGGSAGFCVYSGPAIGDLGWQQRMCAVPYDEIREVKEVTGAVHGPGMDVPPEGWSLYFAEREFGAAGFPALETANHPWLEPREGVIWYRSFWDEGRQSSKCIMAAASPEEARLAFEEAGVALKRFQPVLTNHPSLWADTYDQLSLPHHWECEEPSPDLAMAELR